MSSPARATAYILQQEHVKENARKEIQIELEQKLARIKRLFLDTRLKEFAFLAEPNISSLNQCYKYETYNAIVNSLQEDPKKFYEKYRSQLLSINPRTIPIDFQILIPDDNNLTHIYALHLINKFRCTYFPGEYFGQRKAPDLKDFAKTAQQHTLLQQYYINLEEMPVLVKTCIELQKKLALAEREVKADLTIELMQAVKNKDIAAYEAALQKGAAPLFNIDNDIAQNIYSGKTFPGLPVQLIDAESIGAWGCPDYCYYASFEESPFAENVLYALLKAGIQLNLQQPSTLLGGEVGSVSTYPFWPKKAQAIIKLQWDFNNEWNSYLSEQENILKLFHSYLPKVKLLFNRQHVQEAEKIIQHLQTNPNLTHSELSNYLAEMFKVLENSIEFNRLGEFNRRLQYALRKLSSSQQPIAFMERENNQLGVKGP